MEVMVYQVKGSSWITLDRTIDQLFWGMQGVEIVGGGVRFPSLGQAYEWIGEPYSRNAISATALEMEDWKGRAQPIQHLEYRAQRLQRWLAGRSLLWPEVRSFVAYQQGAKVREDKLRSTVQWLHLTGRAELLPGVTQTRAPKNRQCLRCGGGQRRIQQVACARCNGPCLLCESCVMLGGSRSCLPLIRIPFTSEQKGVQRIRLISPPLTSAQRDTMEACQRWFSSTRSELLVWAVTGSGKTEMLLPVLQRVLASGGTVLWTAPRRDVIKELSQRLGQAFPGVKQVTLHGESQEVWEIGQLFIATVPQLIRFYQFFDLVVVDEADAWPLYGDTIWEAAVIRATAAGGKRVAVTATPATPWKKQVKAGELTAVTLPVRYHGYPLPVPKLIKKRSLWARLQQGKSIPSLLSFLDQVVEKKGQALLFVPRVKDAKTLLRWLKNALPSTLYQGCSVVSGREEARGERIAEFRHGKRWLLVTTTILERGVTVPRCHVAVLGADHPIFDQASLIQIAGRVGRSSSYRAGEVHFFTTLYTDVQKDALREIVALNQLAKRCGYLVKEYKEEGEIP
ncbi:helicase-related protein [Marininema halotolerans]|uniref:Competence protein ComFA n=1 Tax=Marininema halotolerans TaxID=1155944 RepID=A0A1I6P0C7_9BACL|nr:helicase-related protein [Marininema halotolerans]SFS33538.1 competence protein ComFA [Marininema halotolerans]